MVDTKVSKALDFELYASLRGVCRYSWLRNKEKMLYCLKKLSIKKPPMVRTEPAAVNELTSEPLSSCMPLSLPACLTDCLPFFLAWLFAWQSLFNIIWGCTKKIKNKELAHEGSRFLLMYFHTLRHSVTHTVHKFTSWKQKIFADLCSILVWNKE